VIPGKQTKNREDRVVVLNRIARSIIDEQRNMDGPWVFPYKGRHVGKMYNSAWLHARKQAAEKYENKVGGKCPQGFRSIRVHDLKHTYGPGCGPPG
jgi:integrase